MRKRLLNGIKEHMASPEVVEKLARTFSVLADRTRTRIILALSRSELCVLELSELLGMSHSAVSHQLRALKDLELVKCRRDGKKSFYSLIDEHIDNLFDEGLRHVTEKIKEKNR